MFEPSVLAAVALDQLAVTLAPQLGADGTSAAACAIATGPPSIIHLRRVSRETLSSSFSSSISLARRSARKSACAQTGQSPSRPHEHRRSGGCSRRDPRAAVNERRAFRYRDTRSQQSSCSCRVLIPSTAAADRSVRFFATTSESTSITAAARVPLIVIRSNLRLPKHTSEG